MLVIEREGLSTECVIERRVRGVSAAIYLAIIAVCVWKFDSSAWLQHWYWLHQDNGYILVSIFVGLLFVQTLRRIHKESLLIISSFGVIVKRSSGLGTKSEFFELGQIEDIVIVEVIQLQSVNFQLVVVPKQHTPDSEKDKPDLCCKETIPLFTGFDAKLEDLQVVYREVQHKLFSWRHKTER